MKTVYKYHIPVSGKVKLPAGAEILTICLDPKLDEVLYALHSKEADKYEVREVARYGTGWTITEDFSLKFISTVRDGDYMWHYFEIIKGTIVDGV